MHEVGHIGFDVYFSKLPDPRISRKKLYPLIEILFVVLCGSICGAESWRDFVLFGESKIDLLKEDQSRVRKDHAGENTVIVRHIVINMLNKAKGAFKGVGLKALRKKAGWDNETLSFILRINKSLLLS